MAASRSLTEWNVRPALRSKRRPGFSEFAQLGIWIAASAGAFLPFAHDTSPWNAVMLQVPGNQGNWWHFLAGIPFLLAYPMIWLRTRCLFSSDDLTPLQRNLLWLVIASSLSGTMLVLIPFLVHLAGTSDWQRLEVSSLVLGMTVASAVILLMRRIRLAQLRACLTGLNTAYLANACLCLVVYGDAKGDFRSRAGWFLTLVIACPILFELLRLWVLLLRSHPGRADSQLA